MNTFDQAMQIVQHGLHVFPLKGKIPPGGQGFKDATTDPAKLEQLTNRFPQASNLGLQPGRSGLVVVDLDEHKTADAVPAVVRLHQLAKQHGGLPDTLTVRTGSGGRHLYFRADPLQPLGQRNGVYNPETRTTDKGVDVRGDKGYVVLPPSIHPDTGKPYEWVGCDAFDWDRVLPMPPWLIEFLDPPRADLEVTEWSPPPVAYEADSSEQRRVAGIINAVCDQIAELGPGQNRRTELMRAAYRLGGLAWTGYPVENMRASLQSAASKCGKANRDSFRAIDAALADGQEKPYPLPPDSPSWTEARAQHARVLEALRFWAQKYSSDVELESESEPDPLGEHVPDPHAIPKLELSKGEEDEDGNYHPGAPKRHMPNVVAILMHDRRWERRVRFNEFTGQLEFDGGEWDERADLGELRIWLNTTYSCLPSRPDTQEAIIVAAHRNSHDPLRDWMRSLQWDGTPRLHALLTDGFDVQQSDWAAIAGTKWMIGAVARLLSPGCWMDNVLVLHGDQGAGKSKGMATLVGPFHGRLTTDLRDKDSRLALTSSWVLEWDELDSLRRSALSATKSFITAEVDDYRPPYGRQVVKRPRHCVFYGTTNDPEFLRDATGDRRFWVVHATQSDREWLAEQREQLWGEALARYRNGEQWWLTQQEEALRNAAALPYRYQDEWLGLVEEWIGGGLTSKAGFSTAEVLENALGVRRENIDPTKQSRVAKVLRALGFDQERQRHNGARRRLWVRASGANA